ncbi:hypothetical protein [Schleiferilactobacillus perolens]|uniref:Uncharacterized protein n=1 Tax=Schleiferilactobacillus perolens DSM 12744 TaxID=1423792 RepID=A0A0R1N649_9LACO|nr:hypothetical protein [Schleiferilactobacillus perolens]KRL13074.1 hypothetical protein FD09_GL002615 [Schleiferilactobacillus perolens DSM 12744]
MAETKYIQVFRTFDAQQTDGTFYAVTFFPEGLKLDWPYTAVPIPAELKGKVVKYDWDQLQWVDTQVDPIQSQITNLITKLNTTDGKAVAADGKAVTAGAKADDATTQALSAQQALLELSDLVLSKDTTGGAK